MVALDLLRFVIVIAAPLAWYFNLLNFWLLCGLAAATGAASALFQNADVAVLPRLVPKDQLVDANARAAGDQVAGGIDGAGRCGSAYCSADRAGCDDRRCADLLSGPRSGCGRFRRVWLSLSMSRLRPADRSPGCWRHRADIVIGFRAIATCSAHARDHHGDSLLVCLGRLLLRDLHAVPDA